MYWVFPFCWNYLNAWNLLTKLFPFKTEKEQEKRSETLFEDLDKAIQTDVVRNFKRYESDHSIWISKEEDPRMDPSRGGRDPTNKTNENVI
ncbi:MAG: hypothetical protein VX642_15020 [Bdellovibrionota bacterium]|nr:hypothetical protein [Bdellovibrionota bacterium]